MLTIFNPFSVVHSLWRHRALIKQLARRDVESRYRGSFLGFAWSVLTPLGLLATYTYVFGAVFKARWPEAREDSLLSLALVLFCGMLPFNMFAECVNRASTLVVSSPNFVKKVVFPLEVLPVTALLTAVFQMIVGFVVLFAAVGLTSGGVEVTALLLPVALLPLVCLTLGLGWLLASLGVFIRDISQVTGVLLQALFFLTPIFYPLSAVPRALRTVAEWNPLAPGIEVVRDVALWGRSPDWTAYAWQLALSIVVMTLGHAWFMKTKRAFADVV